jgi:clan AA aspartic protease (TIGR02281 family)
MFKFRVLAVIVALFLFFQIEVNADTVYLKNGQNAEGLINKEDKDSLELDLGYGTVIFKKNEIENIYRSSPRENEEIKKNWEINKAQSQETKTHADEGKDKAAEKEKLAAIIAEVDAQRQAAEEKRQIDASAKAVPVIVKRGSLFVSVLLNEKVPVSLVVDTGCPVVILTANIARQLGIDLKSIRHVTEAMLINGKHRVGQITLKSVKLGDLEEKDVEAEVLLEDDKVIQWDVDDGLLGMSFLNKFDVIFDQRNSKLIFKKTQPVKGRR